MPRLLPPRSVGAALGICWDKEREPQLVGSLARLVATTGGRSPWEWLWGHGDLSYRSTVGVVTGSGRVTEVSPRILRAGSDGQCPQLRT